MIKHIKIAPEKLSNKNLNYACNELNKLISEINSNHIHNEHELYLISLIKSIDTNKESRAVYRQIKKVYARITDYSAENFDLYSKDYFRWKWMPIGLLVFGLPLGVFMSNHHISLFVMWVTSGLFWGYLIGLSRDRKARKDGKQMNVKQYIGKSLFF